MEDKKDAVKEPILNNSVENINVENIKDSKTIAFVNELLENHKKEKEDVMNELIENSEGLKKEELKDMTIGFMKNILKNIVKNKESAEPVLTNSDKNKIKPDYTGAKGESLNKVDDKSSKIRLYVSV